MSNHHFEMYLSSSYIDPDNTIDTLDAKTLVEGKWQTLDLNAKTAGFQMFIYGLLSCQHLHFRVNAAESGLMLASSEGSIVIETDEEWHIEKKHVNFKGKLKSGTTDRETTNYIVERMGQCPVSCNMKEVSDSKTSVSFSTS